MSTPLTTGIDWGTQIASSPVTYYFAANGETFDTGLEYGEITSSTWTAYEIQQFELAFSLYESFLSITFDETGSSAGADLILVRGDDASMPDILGLFNPPGEVNAGVGAFNADGTGWDWSAPGSGGLEQGGYGYVTITPRARPRPRPRPPARQRRRLDDLPRRRRDLRQLRRLPAEPGRLHDDVLQRRLAEGPPGSLTAGANFGFEGRPMALDIAVLQAKYGANTRLPHRRRHLPPARRATPSAPFYQCIWDAGGDRHDRRTATARRRPSTSARRRSSRGRAAAATSPTSSGIYGGFTIANGVVIENATGGSGKDTITGNAAANILDGRAGADTMRGLGGADTYVVGDDGDVVDESGGGGVDIVFASVSFDLGDGAHAKGSIENLTLLGTGGIDAVGNGLANILVGNPGGNLLDGKAGADTMRGLAGNDRYVVDDAGDVVDESVPGSGGVDLVRASVDFDLREGSQVRGTVENLTLLGKAAIDGTGNALANEITGNRGNNLLAGGLGRDVLEGGRGKDSFVFDSPLVSKAAAAGNRDKILDFAHHDDRIILSAVAFTRLDAGKLAAGDFASGREKPGKDDHLVYWREKSGKLYYDLDGQKTKGGDVEIAKLNKDADLAANDFFVV